LAANDCSVIVIAVPAASDASYHAALYNSMPLFVGVT